MRDDVIHQGMSIFGWDILPKNVEYGKYMLLKESTAQHVCDKINGYLRL